MGLITGSQQSLEEILASLAYKVDKKKKKTEEPKLQPQNLLLLPTGGTKRRAEEVFEFQDEASDLNKFEEEDEEIFLLSPNTPPQNKCGRRRSFRKRHNKKKESSPPPSSPSSFVRTKIAGKQVVLSRFFPLPPSAFAPVVIDKKEIERVKKMMKKKRTSRNLLEPDGVLDCASSLTAERPRRTKQQKKRRVASPYFLESKQEQGGIKGQQQEKKEKKKRTCILLSAAERESDAYQRVSADNSWEPPPSCHHLLQERHSFDPWRVLIICMLLNITSGKQVRNVLPGLFLLCPDAETATKVPEEEIEKVIQTLGLQRKRARMIKRFSQEYLGHEWTHVTQLHGIGKYAADAYAIFCVGKPQEVIPKDHKLVDYWKFVCGKNDTEYGIIAQS